VFDYRYHALSLAAVLLALAVGVLIGVAIGDSNLVSSAKSGIVANLDSEVDGARRQVGRLQDQLAEQEAFAGALYPLAVHDLLNGRSIGLLFFGSSSNEVDQFVRTAVAQAGGNLTLVAAVREPLALEEIARAAAGTRYSSLAGQPALVQRFGELAGRQLVSGGPLVDRELLSRVRSGLMSAFDGQLSGLQGLVLMRSEPAGMDPEQSESSAAFASGLLDGVARAGVAAVGVELAGTQPSQVPWYEGKNLSSVDDLDAHAGQAALIYALAGAHGAYGVKPTADSLLPSAVPSPTGAR
jgi:Copper transport outer membrane protein, MctB